jgi:hypothetical protein
MAFPSDWPWRWWLRPGEVAAVLKLPDRPTEPLVFTGDDGSLWAFDVFGKKVLWDHAADHLAFGLDGSDPDLSKAFREAIAKLTGGRVHWALTSHEQSILDLLAKEFANAPELSGKKLRHQLRKDFGIDPMEAAYLLERLQPRYVFRIDGEGDSYRLTLPGLFKSSEKQQATTVVVWTLSALNRAYDKDPDFKVFDSTAVMQAPGFEDKDRAFWRNTIALAELGTYQGVTVMGEWWFLIPADNERLAGCKSVPEFWNATIAGAHARRPWPTAPLRLKETIAEQERASRVGEPARPPTRGAGQGIDFQPAQIGFGTVTGSWYDEKTGKLMLGVKPNTPASTDVPRGGLVSRLIAEVASKSATSDGLERAKAALAAVQHSSKSKAVEAASKGTQAVQYDIALSFAGEDRAHAEELAEEIRKGGRTVFYDRYEQADLWGVNLQERLHDVYCNKSRFVVMFISEHYAKKLWTTAERRSAQERAFNEPGRAYILPLVIDHGVEIPGLPLTVIGYADITWGIPEITRLLFEKLAAPP